MPRRVTAWACQFRCGKKTDTNRRRMEEHERRCRMNPARKACPTCANWLFGWNEDVSLVAGEIVESEPYKVYYCDIDKNPKPYLDAKQEHDSPFVYDCEHWRPR